MSALFKMVGGFLFTMLIVACGSDKKQSSSATTEVNSSPIVSIDVMGVDGPMAGADVAVYDLQTYLDNPTSVDSLLLNSVVTDSSTARADGLALVENASDGPFIVVVTANPKTVDLTTGEIPVISEVKTIVEALPSHRVYASPLTTLAIEMAMHEKKSAVKVIDAMGLGRVGAVAHLGFGMSFDIDIFMVPPVLDETTNSMTMQKQVSEYRTATEVFAAIVDQLVIDNKFPNHNAAFKAIINDALDERMDNIDILTAIQSVNADFLTSTGRLAEPIDSILVRENTGLAHDISVVINFEPSPTFSKVFSSPLLTVAPFSNVDFDLDGVVDSEDNCINTPNPDQADNGGINTLVADGVGDACQCGDVNNNGRIDNTDAIILKRHVLGLPPGIIESKCNVSIGENCDNTDAILIQRAILGFPPGIASTCSAAIAFDDDADNVSDVVDNCLLVANQDQANFDGDSVGDLCDDDDDNDGVADTVDSFPFNAFLANDPDGDNVDSGGALGVVQDNCPLVNNSDQVDTDNDSLGDDCDNTPNGDSDNDGIDELQDNCPFLANNNQLDSDNDGTGDICDTTPYGEADDDGDGVSQDLDNCPLDPNTNQLDTDIDGEGDACDNTPNGDSDEDGIDQLTDNCPAVSNPEQIDLDRDGLGDICDNDLQYSTVSGIATAGVMKQARVLIYGVDSGGLRIASSLAEGLTNENGGFNLVVPNYQGPLVIDVVAIPGSTIMVCDINQCEPGVLFGDDYQLTSNFTLSAVIPQIYFGEHIDIDVTLLTTMATALLESSALGINSDSVWSINSKVADLFGLSIDILFAGAIDLTSGNQFVDATIDEQEAAVIASGIFGVINDKDEDLSFALTDFLNKIIDLDGQLYLNEALDTTDDFVTSFDIYMEALLTLNSMDLDVVISRPLNARMFNAASLALFANAGDLTQAKPDPNVGSHDLIIAKDFVAELRSLLNTQSLPSLASEAQLGFDVFADQIAATEAFVGDDIYKFFEVLGRSILAVRYTMLNRYDQSIVYYEDDIGYRIPVLVSDEIYEINTTINGFVVNLIFDYSGTDFISENINRTFQSWECDFWHTYLSDNKSIWNSRQGCENALEGFYQNNQVERLDTNFSLAVSGNVIGPSLSLTINEGSRTTLQASLSDLCSDCVFPEELVVIAEAEAITFDLSVILSSSEQVAATVFEGQLTSEVNNAYGFLQYFDNGLFDEHIEASFGVAYISFLGNLQSGDYSLDMNVFAQATMNDQAIALTNKLNTENITVNEVQIQTEDAQNFNFNLYITNPVLNNPSQLKVQVKGDFDAPDETFSLNIEGVDFGSYSFNSPAAYDRSVISEALIYEFSIDVPLSAEFSRQFLSDDVLIVDIDFSRPVNNFASDNYIDLSLGYDSKRAGGGFLDFNQGSLYVTEQTPSSYVDFDIVSSFSGNFLGFDTPLSLTLEGGRQALQDYEFAAEFAYESNRYRVSFNDAEKVFFTIGNQSDATLNITYDSYDKNVIGDISVGNKLMGNISNVDEVFIVRYPSTGEFESIP